MKEDGAEGILDSIARDREQTGQPDLNKLREKVRAMRGMTKERMGEIALLKMKQLVRKNGIRFPKDAKREIHQAAQDLGISPEEALQFSEALHREILAEMYPDKK